jgi:hypothetical protein
MYQHLLLMTIVSCFAQVRQLMFFVLATSSVMDAMDSLAAAATAALTVPPRSSRKQALAGWTHTQQQQQQQQQHMDAQLLPQTMNGAAAGNATDIEAGEAAAAGVETQQRQQQQQLHNGVSQPTDDSEAAAGAPAGNQAVAAAAAAEPSCSSKLLMRLRSGFERHTAWVGPWLPLAQNRVQFAHLKLALTRELPAMFSSKEGEKAHGCCFSCC